MLWRIWHLNFGWEAVNAVGRLGGVSKILAPAGRGSSQAQPSVGAPTTAKRQPVSMPSLSAKGVPEFTTPCATAAASPHL